jgi:hypothetical protein
MTTVPGSATVAVPGPAGRALRSLGVLAAIGSALAAGASPVSAATYIAHDGDSLSAAVLAADAQAGPSTIALDAGTYTPRATLAITRDVTIAGPVGAGLKIVGSAVMPSGSSLFSVGAGADATFVDLNISTAGGVGGDPAVDVAGAIDVESSALAGNAGPDLMVEPGASAIVRDSTLSDGLGAGLVDDGDARLINSTIAGNAVEGVDDAVGRLSLVNTIVADNGSPDCSAPAASTDHSLDGDGTCRVGALSGVNPQLGPLLASNGGPTPTRALGAGSRAIDAGDEARCPATDQRHYARTDGRCDIGAYEAGAAAAATAPPGGASAGGGGPGAQNPAGATPRAPSAAAAAGASGHGSLRGANHTRITFTLRARVAKPHGSVTYHDAARAVWLKGLGITSVAIDAVRGTATIKGSGAELGRRRPVSFTAVLTDHRGARRLRLRLSSGYVGGGSLISGAIVVTGAGARAPGGAARSTGGNR